VNEAPTQKKLQFHTHTLLLQLVGELAISWLL